jgi:prolipoprotein diacylglyceryl transferase
MTHFLSFTWNFSDGIDLGFYTLHYYSLMFVVAFGLGWYITKKIFDREGEPVEKLDQLLVYVIVGTMIGARLGHVIFYQPELFKEDIVSVFLPIRLNPHFEFTGFTGLASHGAAFVVILAVIWYSKKVIHRPVLWVLDRVALPVASGGVFVRLGNFLNSEILGDVTSANNITAVRFIQDKDTVSPREAMAITGAQDSDTAYHLIQHDPLFAETLAKIPFRYPAQLFEAVGYIFVFAIVFYMYWKTDSRKQHGLIFGVFLVLLWTVRFLVEFVKQSQGGFETEAPLLSTGQWLSIPFILVGFYLIFTAKKRTETL